MQEIFLIGSKRRVGTSVGVYLLSTAAKIPTPTNTCNSSTQADKHILYTLTSEYFSSVDPKPSPSKLNLPKPLIPFGLFMRVL